MTLQIQSDHVYTQLGVAISVTGIAQVPLEIIIDPIHITYYNFI